MYRGYRASDFETMQWLDFLGSAATTHWSSRDAEVCPKTTLLGLLNLHCITLHKTCLFLLSRGRKIVQVAVVDDVEVLQGIHDNNWASQGLRAQTSFKPAIFDSTSAVLAKKCRHLPRGSSVHYRQLDRTHLERKITPPYELSGLRRRWLRSLIGGEVTHKATTSAEHYMSRIAQGALCRRIA